MKEWGRVKGEMLRVRGVMVVVGARVVERDGDRGGLMGWCCAHPAGRGRVFPSTDSRGVRGPWGGQARLPRHVSAPGHAHDGIVGHGQVGLNQFSDRSGWAWSCRSSSSQPGRVRASRRLGRREAADLAVAQAVVDERENLRANAMRAWLRPRRFAMLRYSASRCVPPW